MNTKALINILIVLLTIVALVVLYFYFTQGEEDTPQLIRSGDSRAEQFASAEQSEFLRELKAISELRFNTAILSNPMFANELVDFTTPLPNLGTGRSNPFASFGVGNTNSQIVNTETEEESEDDSAQ